MNMSDFNKFLEGYQKEQAERVAAAARQFAREVVPKLAELGIAKADLQYSGYGDSGGVESATYHNSAGEEIAPTLTEAVQEGLYTYAESLLPPGFEINDGGQGVVKIDVVNGTYKVHHEVNITETESHESEGKF